MARSCHKVLPYEAEIFSQMVDEDGLLIMGRHLGIHRLVRQFVKLYSQPTSLVIVLNTSHEERAMFIDSIAIDGDTPLLPKIITNECDAKRRSEIYLSGGVLFVTSRILVVDMLSAVVPIESLSGFLVCNAQRVSEKSSEAFILRLFREKNKTGFIKAFTESPSGMAHGFAQVQRLMKNLFVVNLFIWPRFHASVAASLTKHPVDVVELDIELTEDMQTIQTAILAIHSMCLQEIKRTVPGIEMDDLSLETGLTSAFVSILRRRLDPIAHRMSAKTRQLQTDLTTIARLLSLLTQYDCVSFHNYLETLRASDSALNQASSWMFQDAALLLFETAKARVYSIESHREKQAKKARIERQAKKAAAMIGKRKGKQNDHDEEPSESVAESEELGTEAPELTVRLEENPKWKELTGLLDEIGEESTASGETPANVLILVSEQRTAWQLRDYLSTGGRQMLHKGFRKHLALRQRLKEVRTKFTTERALQRGKQLSAGDSRDEVNKNANTNRRGRRRYRESNKNNDLENLVKQARETAKVKKAAAINSNRPSNQNARKAYAETLFAADEATQVHTGMTDDEEDDRDYDDDDLDINTFYGILEAPCVIIRSMRVDGGSWHLERILTDTQPRHIIMYDPDPAAIRQIEIFRSLRAGKFLRVYFLWYKDSVEAQRYLTTIRQEKEAFEKLIHEKSRMAHSHGQDGRSTMITIDDPSLRQSSRKARRTVVQPVVVVDVREFRSALPSMLHAEGVHVIPVTIEVGDYIITPDMCVERKSLSDLIGSLKSGRLYNQCMAMQRHYRIPILLIEFSDSSSFGLHSKNDFSGDISWDHMSSKLTLLTSHFTSLRLIWSRSPHMSAEVIRSLKTGHAQPDPATCMAKRSAIEDEINTTHTAATAPGFNNGTTAYNSSNTGYNGSGGTTNTGYYNQQAKQLLLKMPGITSRNVKYVMDNVASVYELSQMNLKEVQTLLGQAAGKQLHDFVNQGL